jgi:hypothetical protein
VFALVDGTTYINFSKHLAVNEVFKYGYFSSTDKVTGEQGYQHNLIYLTIPAKR